MNIDEIDAALGAAPRRARLPEDPWPPIEARMIERVRLRRTGLLSAAAVVLFLAGAAVGYGAARQRAPRSPAAELRPASSAFLAATRVQAAGSAYLAAVGALQRAELDTSLRDQAALSQGYESTLAVLQALAETVEGSPLGGSVAEPLVAEAVRLRRAVDVQLVPLPGGGGVP